MALFWAPGHAVKERTLYQDQDMGPSAPFCFGFPVCKAGSLQWTSVQFLQPQALILSRHAAGRSTSKGLTEENSAVYGLFSLIFLPW